MATPLRKPDPDVEIESELADESLKELRTRPWNVSFFQAVRLLRRAFPSRGAVGEFVPPANEAVREIDTGEPPPPSRVQPRVDIARKPDRDRSRSRQCRIAARARHAHVARAPITAQPGRSA